MKVKRRKVVCTYVIRMNVFVCSKTRVAVQCSDRDERCYGRPSGSRFGSDKMQVCSEMSSQDIPDELKTV